MEITNNTQLFSNKHLITAPNISPSIIEKLCPDSTYNVSIIRQSIPTLLISLIGLTLTGELFDSAMKMSISRLYPILLLSTCILAFKGNIELIFGMHLSSVTQAPNMTSNKYAVYAIDNGCLVIAQSIIIGLTIGIVGTSKSIISDGFDTPLMIRIISSCIISCLISSLIIVAILIPAIWITYGLGINPDNVVLPVLASFGDYFSIATLIYVTEKISTINHRTCLIPVFFVLTMLPIPVYVSLISPRRIPLQSATVLIATYSLSTASGGTLQFFSQKHPILAAAAPVFCGLSGSTSYIYLNRLFTAIYNQTILDRRESYITLIFISLVTPTLYILISNFLFIKYSVPFSILFIVFFVIDVVVLLKMVEYMMRLYRGATDPGVITLPLLTSASDFIGILILILIVEIIAYFGMQ
ncbi:Solute carrier family 41 member 2 [Astathelohania contejeani]|uniref:Solute carrier family 41 member 2 n=1 Tax=Astathelohania contejeani TaxID=164912 RepID=A0ABQ7HYN4_9MICR|nr:Solute carrier family 41 member 2 [Thelohania contejeani]